MPKSSAITDIGRRRQMNQDFVFASDKPVGAAPNLYIVADGMGGHKAGDYASRFTVTRLVQKMEADPKEIFSQAAGSTDSMLSMIGPLVTTHLKEVNRQLRGIAASSESLYGMGTTAVICIVDKNRLHIWNVGDSRLYIMTPSDEREPGSSGETQIRNFIPALEQDTIRIPAFSLKQITRDHSLVEEMIEAGSLSYIGARQHPDRNVITRAVGAEDLLMVDYFTCPVQEGSIILMCSDGLTNMLEDDVIRGYLASGKSLEETAHVLIEKANANGGKDNISVILIDPFASAE